MACQDDLRHCCSHLLAGGSTLAAHFSASFHLSVITHAIAILSAALADLTTNAASTSVELRALEHKVGACLTNFSAVEH